MKEAPYPVTTAHGPAFAHRPLIDGDAVARNHHGAPLAGLPQQDDNEIVCVCGIKEDDGLTVRGALNVYKGRSINNTGTAFNDATGALVG